MKFTKMHGIGNDYVYVNCFEETVADPVKTAIAVSPRHFAIGSDGLILIKPSKAADCRMEIYNADGSQAEMCGNGVRCVGKYAYDHGIVDKSRTTITVETGAGIKTLKLTVKDGKAVMVEVDMGSPVLTSHQAERTLAMADYQTLSTEAVWEKIEAAGKTWDMICVSMGNPHAVVYVEDTDSLEIEKIGPFFENHPRFPDRTNTEFVQVVDGHTLKMRVWERGSGETFACGTGACAVLTASSLAGYVKGKADIKLLGGTLHIELREEDGHVMMTGPAAEVFSGEWNESD